MGGEIGEITLLVMHLRRPQSAYHCHGYQITRQPSVLLARRMRMNERQARYRLNDPDVPKLDIVLSMPRIQQAACCEEHGARRNDALKQRERCDPSGDRRKFNGRDGTLKQSTK